jgi:hemolysin III
MDDIVEYRRPTTVNIVEEVLNSTIHGIGAIAGIIGLIFGLIHMTTSENNILLIGFIIYGICLILLMSMSSLYHALKFTKAKSVFQKLDHSGILLLIAGSYTPFIIYLFEGWQMYTMLAFVWSIAVFGIGMKTAMPNLAKKVGVGLYIGFGWLALLLLPRFGQLGGSVTTLLVLGGLFYTVGAMFMAFKKPFVHVGWHVMVVLAACMHYAAIIKLAA